MLEDLQWRLEQIIFKEHNTLRGLLLNGEVWIANASAPVL